MKKPALIIVAGVAIIAAAAGAFFAGSQNSGGSTTAPSGETTSVTQAVESKTSQTTSEPSETTTVTTSDATTETTTATDTSFVTNGFYYLYDDEKTACYVFSFDGKGKVNLVQFDDTNIIDEDPEYFKGYAKYSIKDGTVTLSSMPKSFLLKSLTLTVKDGKLYADKTVLEKHGDVSMSYAVKHFGN